MTPLSTCTQTTEMETLKGILRNPHQESQNDNLKCAVRNFLAAYDEGYYDDQIAELRRLVKQTPQEWDEERKQRAARFDKFIDEKYKRAE